MNSATRVTGRVIFCDDIREEVGNRFTIIGAILGGLHYPAFPAILPKLGLFILAEQPLEGAEPFELSFSFEEYDGDTVDLGMQRIGTDIPPVPEKIPPPTDGIKKLMVQANFIFSPFVANKPGRLIVRTHQQDCESVLGELDIVPHDEAFMVKAAAYPFELRPRLPAAGLPQQSGSTSGSA